MKNIKQPGPNNPDIFIVGTGIMGIWHLTKETEACLQASRHVFLIDHGYGIAQYIANLGPTVHNLLPEYTEGANRLDIYRTMAAKVLAQALEERPVSFAVYGHPNFFVYPSTLIKQGAEHLNLTVHTAAAVSCFDTMLIDLNLDPAMNGLQIYEANALIVENRKLDIEVPCLLLQVDAVESAYFTASSSKIDRFLRFQQHLLQFYPPDHMVTNVRSASFPIYSPELITFRIDQVAQEYASKNLGGTLYVPKARHTVLNEDIVKQVFDPEYLKQISFAK